MESRYRLYGYLGGATTARTGDEMSGPALLVLGLAVTGSPAAASSLLAGLTIAAAVGGPVFGALLDRSRYPGRLLAATLAAYALGLTTIMATLGRLPIPAVVALAVVAGLFNPAVAGGWTSQVPHVLGGRPLHQGNALDGMTFSVASLAGPAFAGLAANAFGAPVAMAAAVGLVALALPAAWSLPSRDRPESVQRLNPIAGFTAIATSRSLLRATTTSTVSYVGIGVLVVCCPLLGEQRLGGAARGTLLLSVLAAAALLANALLARRLLKPDTIVVASTVVLAVGMALAAVAHSIVLLVVAVAVAGIGESPQLTALFAIRHREAPEHLRAQVFATGASLKITGFAIGSAIAGPLAAHSLTLCLLAAAGIELLAVRTPSPGRGASPRCRGWCAGH